jgi:hypothetical protein
MPVEDLLGNARSGMLGQVRQCASVLGLHRNGSLGQASWVGSCRIMARHGSAVKVMRCLVWKSMLCLGRRGGSYSGWL